MDTDLSLIEIDEVDDLLVELKKDEIKTNTNTNSYIPDIDLDMDTSSIDFLCSPLHIDRSNKQSTTTDRSRFHPSEVGKDKVELQKPSCSSPTRSNNKENLDEHNVGSRSPSEDPQQIKRRKKGGGYNLRKSLAWNKAFFTEDGVLDPSELSRLSKRSGRFLSSVPEEVSSSLRKGSKLSVGGLDLLSVEKKLFHESPKKLLNEDQKIHDMPMTESSSQQDASSVPRASRKMHMTKGPSRIVSQGGGCPRPSGLSSVTQKRLPNSSTLNGTVKDSKVPKRVVLKPESSAGAKSSKCNQKVPPVTTEKSVGLRRSSMSTQKAPSSTSSSFKPSILRSGKNTTSLPKDKRLSTDLRPPQSTKGTIVGVKMSPDPVHGADEPTGESCSEVTDSILPKANNSRNIPKAQIQPAKPSGLRMPSPSLRYFDQPKSSASQSSQSLKIQSRNFRESGIPNPRKLSQSNHIGEPKRPNVLAETVRLTKGSTDMTTVEANALSSTLKCLLPPAGTTASHPTLKPQVESNETSSQQNLHQVHVPVDEHGWKQEDARGHAHEVDQILHDVNQGLELKDNSLPLHTGSPAQLQKDAHLEKQEDARNHAQVEVERISDFANQGLEPKDNSLARHAGFPKQFKKDIHLENQEDARNHAHDEVEQILHAVNQGLEMNDESLALHTGSPEHFEKHIHFKKREDAQNHVHNEVEQDLRDVDQGLELKDNPSFVCSGSPEQCQRDSHLEKQENARNDAQNEDEQISHDVNQGLALSENSLPPSTESPEQLKKATSLGMQEDARNRAQDEVEQVLRDVNQGLEPNDNPSFVCTGSPEQFQKDNHLENIMDANLVKEIFCGSESGNLHVPLSWNSHMQVNGACKADVVEHGHVEKTQLESLYTDMSIDTYDTIPNMLLGDDNASCGASTSMVHVEGVRVAHSGKTDELAELINPCTYELEQIYHTENLKILVSDSILVEQSGPSDESQEDNGPGNISLSRDFGCQMKASDVQSPVGHMMQLKEDSSRVDDIKRIRQAEESHVEPLTVPSSSRDSTLGIEFKDATNEGNPNCCSRTGEGVKEQAEEQLNVGKPCPYETEVHLQESNYRLEMNDGASLLQNTSSEELQEDDTLDLQIRSYKEPLKTNDHENIFYEDMEITYPSGNPCESSHILHHEIEADLQESDYRLEMKDSTLLLQSTSSEELQEDNTLDLQNRSYEGPLRSNDHENIFYADMEITSPSGNPSESSHILHQLEPMMQVKEGDAGDDKKIKHTYVEDASLECSEMNPCESFCDSPNRNKLKYSAQCTMGFESSLKLGEDQTAGAVATYDSEVLSYSKEKITPSVQTTCGDTHHGIEVNERKIYASPEKPETDHSEISGVPDGASLECLEMNPLGENLESFCDSPNRNTLEHSTQDNMGFESSFKLSEDRTAGAEATYDSEVLSYSTEKIPPSAQTPCGNTPLGIEVNEPKIYASPEKPETDHSETSRVPDGASLECLEMNPLVENLESFCDSPSRNTLEHSTQDNMGFKLSEDRTAGAVAIYASEVLSYSTEEIPPSAQTPCGNTPHGIEVNEPKIYASPEKPETDQSETSGIPDGELQSESDKGVSHIKSEAVTVPAKRKSPEVSTQDALTIKYKLNAVPFSDEWLAALEAAGEEILALKTGPVQNSPPDKSVPEPSPWSPVKRKNHEIGPFDCTKCTNLPPPSLP